MDTRSASASSGSTLGSIPNSMPSPGLSPLAAAAAPAAAAAAKALVPPSSPCMIGDVMSASASTAPVSAGTVSRCELSLELTAPMNASSLALDSSLEAASPKATTSTATLFFFSFLPIFTSAACSTSSSLPQKSTMRWRWFLFWRCLSASCATCRPVTLSAPSSGRPCSAVRILPRSVVGVTTTDDALPAIVITPTVFSGLACVLAPHRMLMASACAWKRVGA
mmetsp:Transcript_12010/g.50523  ORF Transcript_12010/g.50523 Transcript_12010/m.50523 type:complete len:223 (+) Transcript_12010:1913-2581(+)